MDAFSLPYGGILALRAHCALLLDYVPPEGPLGTPLGNTLRIRRPKLDWRGPGGGPSRFLWHGEKPGAFGGELDCVLGSGDGGQSGGESELGMAKEMDSILHCRFTTLNPSWYYSKWRSPSSTVPTTVAGGRRPLERM